MSDSDAIEPKRAPLTGDEKQARALRRNADAEAAMREYRSDEQAMRDRLARLRAERLERQETASQEQSGPHDQRKLP